MKQTQGNPISGPLPNWLSPVSWLASRAYGVGVERRNRDFDAGVGVERLPLPVISVGNLTAGGTGKTPLVMHLVKLLQQHGHTPLVAMRGYAAKGHGESDEEAEYHRRLPNTTVLANPKRFRAISEFLEGGGEATCVVLDDGFQHRRLGRQLDLVLVDATRPFTRDRLLPLGYLREPAESLGRADGVIITRAAGLSEAERTTLAAAVAQAHGRSPIAWTTPRWVGLDSTKATPASVEDLRGLPVLSVCALGNPAAFNDQLRRAGAEIVRQVALRDHHPYSAKLTEKLLRAAAEAGAEALVTTAKDWVKIERHAPALGWPLPVLRPILEVEILSGASTLERLVLDAVTEA